MPTVEEIKKLKEYLVGFHSKRITQQKRDASYVDDNFGGDLDYLPQGTHIVKTGKAYRMVSAPAEHIITKKPQLYRDPVDKGDTESADRVAKEGNRWLRILVRQNPQPIREHVKKMLGKGEAWIYTPHNEDYDPDNPNSLPAHFIIPDPTIVFVDPWAGETNGVPNRVIISFDRIAGNIKKNYRYWEWSKRGGRKDDTLVNFFMYIDNDIRYFEGDGDPLLADNKGKLSNGDGIQENIYGLVPLVHCYAGFGESSPDGDPASLCISRITKVRDLIAEYTAIRSTINTLIFKYGFPPLDFYYTPGEGEIPKNFREEYSRELLAFNMVPVTGNIKEPIRKGVDMLPDIQLFQHLRDIEMDIDKEDPLGTIGQAIGDSGRQQLDAKAGAFGRYDSVVENSQSSFETAIGNVLRITEKVPSVRPKGIKEGDLKGNYQVQIELKAEDPVANQISSADGDRKQMNGIIDWETNLVEYQRFTKEEAEEIMDNAVIDKIILEDPVTLRMLALKNAEERGTKEEYLAIEAQLGQTKEGGIGSQGGPPRTENIQTQRGAEETDMSRAKRPIRRSPGG